MQRDDGAVMSGPDGFPYTEITGYFVKFAIQYGLIAEAVKSSNYLIELNKDGFISWNGTDDIAYSFDTMIVADALLDMFDYSFEDKYYTAAGQMANRIASIIEQLDRLPTMSSQEGNVWDDPNMYYKVPGAHYVKLIPIFKRFKMDTEFLERFLSLQRDDGAFHCNRMTRYSFTHFHAYALDGIKGYYPNEYERGALWAKDNLMEGTKKMPAWTSDRSWSMPGACLQCAYHLNEVGERNLARVMRETALREIGPTGGITIRDDRGEETWPSLFAYLYRF
jgi:hypothetical protein